MVLKLPFSYNSVPKIRFGAGSINESIADLTALMGKKIMMITDQGLSKIGLYLSKLEKIEEC